MEGEGVPAWFDFETKIPSSEAAEKVRKTLPHGWVLRHNKYKGLSGTAESRALTQSD